MYLTTRKPRSTKIMMMTIILMMKVMIIKYLTTRKPRSTKIAGLRLEGMNKRARPTQRRRSGQLEPTCKTS